MEKVNKKILNTFLIIISIFLIIKSIIICKEILKTIISIIKVISLSFFLSYSLYPVTNKISKKIPYKSKVIIILIILSLIIISTSYLLIFNLKEEYLSIKININDFINENIHIKNSINKNSILIIDKSTNIIKNILLIVALSICFLFNMENIIKRLCKNKIIKNIEKELYLYYKGFYIIIIIEIIEYALIYKIINHPFYLLLGTMSGITTLIPFFGAILTNTLALISSISISKKLFIKTAIVMIIIPIFNQYIIEPKIYQKMLKISVINIILSVFIFGTFLGIEGIILSMPLLIISKNIIEGLTKKELSLKL